MVDAPHSFVVAKQAMAALAVGVVGHDVEHSHQPKLVVQVFAFFENGEVMLLVIGFDKPLHRAFADGSFAKHGVGHNPKSHCLAEPVCGYLSAVEPRFEIPEWSFAAQGFVDRLSRAVLAGEVHQECGVAAPGHAANNFDLARVEQVVD